MVARHCPFRFVGSMVVTEWLPFLREAVAASRVYVPLLDKWYFTRNLGWDCKAPGTLSCFFSILPRARAQPPRSKRIRSYATRLGDGEDGLWKSRPGTSLPEDDTNGRSGRGTARLTISRRSRPPRAAARTSWSVCSRCGGSTGKRGTRSRAFSTSSGRHIPSGARREPRRQLARHFTCDTETSSRRRGAVTTRPTAFRRPRRLRSRGETSRQSLAAPRATG